MTDYSKIDDFVINHLVDVATNHQPGDGNSKDYCNNPAGAWPIIVENGIGVAPSKKDPYAWDLSGGMLRGIKHSDKNPLRAAMIVFLMMKDAENEANN